MGAWQFADRRIETALSARPRYVGRPAAASPASGLAKIHAAEQVALVGSALTVEKK